VITLEPIGVGVANPPDLDPGGVDQDPEKAGPPVTKTNHRELECPYSHFAPLDQPNS
jgi:hypothetical protein